MKSVTETPAIADANSPAYAPYTTDARVSFHATGAYCGVPPPRLDFEVKPTVPRSGHGAWPPV